MKQKIRFATALAGLATTLMILLTPSLAAAQTPVVGGGTTACPQGQDCANKGLQDIAPSFPATVRTQDLPTLIRTVINWALYLSAIVAVIFIIIGGFMYITSAGDPAKATKGRTTLVNALIGLAIIILSYMIVQVVYNFLTH